MSLFKDRLFVLGSSPLGENDHLFRLYGRNLGNVKATASGSQKPRSRWTGLLNSMNVVDAVMYRKCEGKLFRFNEVDVVKRYSNIITELDTTAIAFGILELPDKFLPENQEDPKLFDLMESMMEFINVADHFDARFALTVYEYMFLMITGYGLQLDFCVECNRPRNKRAAYISVSRGGVVCRSCKQPDEHARLLSKTIMGMLTTLKVEHSFSDFEKTQKKVFIREVKPLLEDWFLYYFDKRPVATDMLGAI